MANFIPPCKWYYSGQFLFVHFSPFCFASPEVIGVKVDHRQTNSLTPYVTVGNGQDLLHSAHHLIVDKVLGLRSRILTSTSLVLLPVNDLDES